MRSHLVVLAVLILSAVSFGSACDANICFNTTYAKAAGIGVYPPYDDCMDAAGDVVAYQCHCTLQQYKCLLNTSYGNCTDWRVAQPLCRINVLYQFRGCSPHLCRLSSSPSRSAVSCITFAAALVAILSAAGGL